MRDDADELGFKLGGLGDLLKGVYNRVRNDEQNRRDDENYGDGNFRLGVALGHEMRSHNGRDDDKTHHDEKKMRALPEPHPQNPAPLGYVQCLQNLLHYL